MKPRLQVLAPLALFALLATGCPATDPGPETRDFEMSGSDVAMEWVITRDMELACSAPEMAGGEIAGEATFGELGQLDIAMSAAWDIAAANPDPTQAEYEPTSPYAGGPFAPVLDQDDYPHTFAANPFAQPVECDPTVSAEGQLELTAENGDEIVGLVTGGETHRLDVNQEGDGIEVFAEIAFDGGTGAFTGASGSAVLHLITHVDPAQMEFVIDEIGVLPGGEITY